MDYPHLKRSVVEHRDLYDSSVILIEDKASGQPLIQELQWGGVEEVVCYTPEGDKVMRLHAQTGMIEGGFVYVPGIAPWLDIYLHELTTFPASKHDDQTDSTSQFLDWSKQASNVKPRKITAIYLGGNSRRSAWDPSSIW